jgi:hypothetical protein
VRGDPWLTRDVVWQARLLVQVGLPHRDPGDVLAWSRVNGRIALQLQPGVITDDRGETRSLGLPSAGWPRLVLIDLVTEAVRNHSRTVELGSSVAEYLRRIAPPTGRSPNGRDYRALHTQMDRLLGCRAIVRDVEHPVQTSLQVASGHALWWDVKRPEDRSLWPSQVVLDADFYDRLVDRPVPLDRRAVWALRGSSLALDLYVWATYRVTYLDAPIVVPWASLRQQLGSHYTRDRDLRRYVVQAMRAVGELWPEVRWQAMVGGLVLAPSRPHVPVRAPRSLVEKSGE